MKNSLTTRMLALVAAVCLSITAAAQAMDPLPYVPSDTEVLLSLNVRQIADNPRFQTALEEKGGAKAQAGMRVFEKLTGINILEDIDRAFLWCRMGDDGSVLLLLQGRFDEAALTDLLVLNEKYDSRTIDGVTVHEWHDEKEDRMKFGVFLADGSVMIANRLDTVQNALAAARTGSGLLSSHKAGFLPADRDLAAAWGIVFRPDKAVAGRKGHGLLSAECAAGMLELGAQEVGAHVEVTAESAQAARHWQDLARGWLALLLLQEDSPEIRDVARNAVVSAGTDNRVILDLSLSYETLVQLMEKRKDQRSHFHPGGHSRAE